MPINIDIVTQRMPQPADPLKITMPCGSEVVASLPGVPVANGKAMAQSLLDKANAAMAPLGPIFKLLDAFLVGVELARAIPELVTNPAKLIEQLEKLIGVASALTKLVPPLSVPLLALEFIDAFIAYLQGTIQALEDLMTYTDKIEEMRAQAARYPTLNVVVEVSEYNLDVMKTSLKSNTGSVEKIVRFVNVLMQLAGLEGIPSVSSLSGAPDEAIQQLRDTLTQVRRIRSLIPL